MDYTANLDCLPLHDKDQHALVGAVVGDVLRGERTNRAGAYVRIILLAVAKEAADATSPDTHDADPFDAASTIGGGIAAYEGLCVVPVVDRHGAAILVRCSW